MKRITLRTPCTIAAAAAAAGQDPGTIAMDACNGGLLAIEGWDHPIVCADEGIRPAAELIPVRIGHGPIEAEKQGAG